jgi:hypothetical protein
MAFGYMWASLRWNVMTSLRNAMIKMDKEILLQEPESKERNEKLVTLTMLSMKEYLLKEERKRSKSKKDPNPYFEKFKELYEKYKDSLSATMYLKNQSLEARECRDVVMEFFVSKDDLSYILFGIGLVLLLTSVIL